MALYPRGLIDDDKTLVVICDDAEFPDCQPDAYYAVPDWDEIRRKRHEAVMAAYAAEDAEEAMSEDCSSAAEDVGDSEREEPQSLVPTALGDLAEAADSMADVVEDAVREAMPAWRSAARAVVQAGRAVGDGCKQMGRSLKDSLRSGDER